MNHRGELFRATKQERDSNLVETAVNFVAATNNDRRRTGHLRSLSPEEKMLCALRKALADLSARGEGARYFVTGNQCRVVDAQTGDGEYRFRGRAQIGVTHPSGETAFKMVEFTISFRDTEDEIGLPDVDYYEPSTIVELAPHASL